MASEILYNYPYLSVLIAFAIGYICMPATVQIAKKRNFVVSPNKRTSHKGAVPNVGGMNIFIAFFLTVSMVSFQVIDQWYLLFIGIFFILIVGFVDDLIDIKARWKLAGQLAAGFFLIVLSDIRLYSFQGFLGIYELPLLVSYAISFFVYIVIVNALNLIDGIDGLASGLGILYCLFFGIYFTFTGNPYLALSAYTLVGALAVFFIYNVFGRKNKIFMGDCGSLFLGFMINLFVFQFLTMNAQQAVPEALYMASAPAVVICVLIVPLFDTMRVMITRIKNKRSPFEPDRNHIHHLLLKIGMKHRQVSFVLMGETLFFVALGILGRNWNITLLIAIALALKIGLTVFLWKIVDKQAKALSNSPKGGELGKVQK